MHLCVIKGLKSSSSKHSLQMMMMRQKNENLSSSLSSLNQAKMMNQSSTNLVSFFFRHFIVNIFFPLLSNPGLKKIDNIFYIFELPDQLFWVCMFSSI